MNKNIVETLIGFAVIAVAVFFVFFSYFKSDSSASYSGYKLSVNFDRVDGLNIGSDVRVSGLKIGKVIDAKIDSKTYQAKVEIDVDSEVKIPADSSAEIISAGLLGDKYIALVPGGSENNLKDGDTIRYSQSSISIESLIGKFMFGDDEKKDNKKSKKSEEFF
ncbi:MAG: outer membrane lipid asymmetry maintenance protein MlaD [Rickettsiales bacterium]|nr:outer membrane lipid asymmetry maintenance protein MlaD [Rickettsiales bacterium]